MKKKRSLTLLEIIIGLVLLGVLLTSLFNCFYQGIIKNNAAKELKQKILHLELFQQRIKNLFSALYGKNILWLEKHPNASGLALYSTYKQSIDFDPNMCGVLEGMLFLNKNNELCFASWPEYGEGRMEVLLCGVSAFRCRLFDPKKGEWRETWSTKEEKKPIMVAIDLEWSGVKVPFVFFLSDADEKMTYPAIP